MIENRELWLATLFEVEGGYVNDPDDPGGVTNYGITWRTLSDWRGCTVQPEDVAQLTKQEVSAIYLARFWQVMRGDQLPAGLDLYAADFAVNSGPARAASELQRLVGTEDDGFVGPKTLEAVRKKDPLRLLLDYDAARMRFLLGLEQWDKFGRGWTNRCNRVCSVARGRIQARPTLAEAAKSTIITTNGTAAAASAGGLGWAGLEYGPTIIGWLQDRAIDPATIEHLRSGVEYVSTANLPTVVIVLASLLAVSLGVNLFSAWKRLHMWRTGAV